MTEKKTNRTTLEEKIMIIDYFRSSNRPQNETVEHFKDKYSISTSSLSAWIRQEDELRKRYNDSMKEPFGISNNVKHSKRKGTFKYAQINDAMSKVVAQRLREKLPINESILRKYWAEYAKKYGVSDPKRVESFSHGWLANFKKRLGLKITKNKTLGVDENESIVGDSIHSRYATESYGDTNNNSNNNNDKSIITNNNANSNNNNVQSKENENIHFSNGIATLKRPYNSIDTTVTSPLLSEDSFKRSRNSFQFDLLPTPMINRNSFQRNSDDLSVNPYLKLPPQHQPQQQGVPSSSHFQNYSTGLNYTKPETFSHPSLPILTNTSIANHPTVAPASFRNPYDCPQAYNRMDHLKFDGTNLNPLNQQSVVDRLKLPIKPDMGVETPSTTENSMDIETMEKLLFVKADCFFKQFKSSSDFTQSRELFEELKTKFVADKIDYLSKRS